MAIPAAIGIIGKLIGTAAAASGGGGEKEKAQGLLGSMMNQMPQQGAQMGQNAQMQMPAKPMFNGQPLGPTPASFEELAATAPPENPTSKWGQFVQGGGIGNAIRLASQFRGSGQRNQPPPWPMPMPQTPGLNPFDVSRAQQQQPTARPPLQNFGMSRFRMGRRV